jgi:hypothetical protein
MFREKDGKIILNTNLYKAVEIGAIQKITNTSIHINTKYNNDEKNYNLVTIKNTPLPFPAGDIDMNSQATIGGRINKIQSAIFANNKALIFAIDFYDKDDNNKNTKGYGIYPLPKGKVQSISSNSNDPVINLKDTVNLMNPKGLFHIYDNTGKSEIKQGKSRAGNSITLSGGLNTTFHPESTDVIIEQIDKFKLYNYDNGEERYKGENVFTGRYVNVDKVNKFTSIRKHSFSSTFEQNVKGEIIIKDKAITPEKLSYQYAKIWDERPSDVSGGNALSNNWVVRKFTEIDSNIEGVKLLKAREDYYNTADTINKHDDDSNFSRFTLPKGIYKISITAPACGIQNHRVTLYSNTNSTWVAMGSSEVSNTNATSSTNSTLITVHTVNSQETFSIRHYITGLLTMMTLELLLI